MTNICRCGTYQRIREAIHTAAVDDRQGIGSAAMSNRIASSVCTGRRGFIVSAAAAGGGFALGWRIAGRAQSADLGSKVPRSASGR